MELYRVFDNAIEMMFELSDREIYIQCILPVSEDKDLYRDAIINHWNRQKYMDEKLGNPLGRCGYYKFAQQDLDLLNDLFIYA